jgi:uncharacterized protein
MEEIALLTFLTLLASAIGTLSGFGTSTIMVPVLTFFYPLPVTLLFVGIIHFFGDVWKMLFFRSGLNWGLILGFGIPGIAASYLGASLSTSLPEALAGRLLGGFLLAYVIFIVLNRDWQLPRKRFTAITGGTLSGLFAGVFGVGGAVRGAFLAAFNLPKATYVFTSGAIAFLIDAVRVTTYAAQGIRLAPSLLYGMLIFIPASLAGAYLAKQVIDRIPQQSFRLVIALFLGAVAIRFLVFA